MRRETQNLLLLLLGGAVLKIVLTGTYVRYVKPTALPWLVVAGGVMVVLAVVAILRDMRVPESTENAGCDGHGADGGNHQTRSPWMLLLPVLAIFLIAPPALGADSVNRAGDRSAVSKQGADGFFGELPAGPAPLLTMSEFVTRAVWDGSGALNGREVRLRGFVVHPDPGRAQIARMRIGCCAADAAPIRIDLAGPAAARAAAMPADSWIEVVARLRPSTATEANGHVPTVDVTELRPTEAPADPYEY